MEHVQLQQALQQLLNTGEQEAAAVQTMIEVSSEARPEQG